MAYPLRVDGIEYSAKSKTTLQRHHKMSLAVPGQWLLPSSVRHLQSYASLVSYGTPEPTTNRYQKFVKIRPIYEEVWYADERVLSVDLSKPGFISYTMYTPKTVRQSPKISVAARHAYHGDIMKFRCGPKSAIWLYCKVAGTAWNLYAHESVTFHTLDAERPGYSRATLPWITLDGEVVSLLGRTGKKALRRHASLAPLAATLALRLGQVPLQSGLPLRFGGGFGRERIQALRDQPDHLLHHRAGWHPLPLPATWAGLLAR